MDFSLYTLSTFLASVFAFLPFLAVTPAKAGVQGDKRALATLDPGFRRDDEEE
jgi:hypothetical protein